MEGESRQWLVNTEALIKIEAVHNQAIAMQCVVAMAIVDMDMLMTVEAIGSLVIIISLFQKYYHGESIAVNVLVDNNTNKSVKKIKISGELLLRNKRNDLDSTRIGAKETEKVKHDSW